MGAVAEVNKGEDVDQEVPYHDFDQLKPRSAYHALNDGVHVDNDGDGLAADRHGDGS